MSPTIDFVSRFSADRRRQTSTLFAPSDLVYASHFSRGCLHACLWLCTFVRSCVFVYVSQCLLLLCVWICLLVCLCICDCLLVFLCACLYVFAIGCLFVCSCLSFRIKHRFPLLLSKHALPSKCAGNHVYFKQCAVFTDTLAGFFLVE